MNILEEALSVVTGPRAAAYGDARVNWGRTAEIASSIIGKDLTPEELVLILVAVKLARLHTTGNHRDSIVDLAGYAQILAYVAGVDEVPQ